MALNLKEYKRHAKEYVEIQGRTTVLSVRFFRRYRLFGREDVVLLVHTTDKQHPDWWIVGGSTPMNLYSVKDFPEPDVAYSLHHGLMLRMADQNYQQSSKAPQDIGYDAFISHAGEDKKAVVRPLSKLLKGMGYRVWFDEFELRVGDSLRRSIDQGLASSRFGVVVLSKAFFRKNWPQYELDGLTAREIDGRKVILPVWHGIGREEVARYSSPLADKVAISTSRAGIKKIAESLAKVFDS